eukprot:2345385-Pyramimonas_sp.AAC.1
MLDVHTDLKRTTWDYDKLAMAPQKGKNRKEFYAALEFNFGKHQDKLKESVGDNTVDEHGELIVNITNEAAKPPFERPKSKLDQYYQLMEERLRLLQARAKLTEEYIGTDPKDEIEYRSSHVPSRSRSASTKQNEDNT